MCNFSSDSPVTVSEGQAACGVESHSLWPQMGPLKRYLNILILSFLFPETGRSAGPCRNAAGLAVHGPPGVRRVKKKTDKKPSLLGCV